MTTWGFIVFRKYWTSNIIFPTKIILLSVVLFTHLFIYSFCHSIQGCCVAHHQAAPLISLSMWMLPLELGSTQPAQLYCVAPIQQYIQGEYVPGTVLGTESKVVSKVDLDLALMETYFR